MKLRVKKEEPPGEHEKHIILAYLILAPKSKVLAIKELYPEYFAPRAEVGSLEHISDLNSSYLKWREDYAITKEWITEFPTNDIYHNYVRYCIENRLDIMSKRLFYHTLEVDFDLVRRQDPNGAIYFNNFDISKNRKLC